MDKNNLIVEAMEDALGIKKTTAQAFKLPCGCSDGIQQKQSGTEYCRLSWWDDGKGKGYFDYYDSEFISDDDGYKYNCRNCDKAYTEDEAEKYVREEWLADKNKSDAIIIR